MFERNGDYPTAVASYDDEGVDAAITWCRNHLQAGDTLTVWTSLKSNLRNCRELEQLVNRNSNVEHTTGRAGGPQVRGRGPVLMAWADMDDIGELVRFSGPRIRALCVITYNEDNLNPWVAAAKPVILGDGTAWENPEPELEPVLLEALEGMTKSINHNNTIAARGYEKNTVVSILLALHDAGIPMDGEAMQGWALTHGWSGKNPQHLRDYVTAINNGKRPRADRMLRSDYIDRLREKVAAGD
ncbi:hypothetical protein [Actinoplanes auranticolor]|uniref:Uncharacterized protein n=1 Tax=Actinoplanes auranticolor TaxID=47988 RepID=A0A919S5S3_9ACTN|nr:hypothetical protein [Actinoplanes auranticolor]GIM64588.1 hypothetical protein Aau02nite_11400 [Actinoplanes auranticolor]